MIHYLVTAEHAYTMGSFLESWGERLRDRVSIVTYESVFAGRPLPNRGAIYVFSDLDRLSEAARDKLGPLRDHLAGSCGAARVLNDPRRSLQRLDLLRTLHRNGVNRFAALRVSEQTAPARFPVFIRDEAGFQQTQLPLIQDAAAYEAAVRALQRQGARLERLLAVEFCPTADAQGIHRKYGAFVVGERIVPRHLFFSRDWMVKLADLAEPALIAEELAYLDANPHAAVLREAARLAGIAYDRIDYGLLDGRPQIWEINTNPMLARAISAAIPARRPAHLKFVAMIEAAFAALEAADAPA